MPHEPIISPRYLEFRQFPSHVRGPNYTRATFAEYGPEPSFQAAPIWTLSDGSGLQGTEQAGFLTACGKILNEDDCALRSREIGDGKVTVEQAECELRCEASASLPGWATCVGDCYRPWYEKLGSNPYVLGGLALGVGYLVLKAQKKPAAGYRRNTSRRRRHRRTR